MGAKGSGLSGWLKEADERVRRAEVGPVAQELERLLKRRPRREHLEELARLAWRVGNPLLGIRLLFPVVSPSGGRAASASAGEKAEFALCLVKAGAVDEGRRALENIAGGFSRLALYRAFAEFSRWEYGAAIPLLKTFLQQRLSAYDRHIGQLNLASALVYERRHVEAELLLKELLHESGLRGWDFARARLYQLAAESFTAQRRWDRAEVFLDRCQRELGGTPGVTGLFARKLRAIARCLREKGSVESLSEMERVQAQAGKLSHWETVRDCDRIAAIAAGDGQRLLRVYFGTPYRSYRESLLGDFPGKAAIPELYRWEPRGGGGPVLDLITATVTGRSTLKRGQLQHRLLCALTADFYRPYRVVELHAALYPGEHFHPDGGPLRVRQAVARARSWIEAVKLPLEVAEDLGFYRLKFIRPVSVVTSFSVMAEAGESPQMARLRDAWPVEPFSRGEAARVLEMPARSVLRLLEQAMVAGDLLREGEGSRTRYRFTEKER